MNFYTKFEQNWSVKYVISIKKVKKFYHLPLRWYGADKTWILHCHPQWTCLQYFSKIDLLDMLFQSNWKDNNKFLYKKYKGMFLPLMYRSLKINEPILSSTVKLYNKFEQNRYVTYVIPIINVEWFFPWSLPLMRPRNETNQSCHRQWSCGTKFVKNWLVKYDISIKRKRIFVTYPWVDSPWVEPW